MEVEQGDKMGARSFLQGEIWDETSSALRVSATTRVKSLEPDT